MLGVPQIKNKSYILLSTWMLSCFILFQLFSDAMTSTVKLVITCLVNGLVHDESEAIHKVLDRMSAKCLNDYDYKELVLMKTISRGQSFGFTVGGFGQLRKSTLIQVCVI